MALVSHLNKWLGRHAINVPDLYQMDDTGRAS